MKPLSFYHGHKLKINFIKVIFFKKWLTKILLPWLLSTLLMVKKKTPDYKYKTHRVDFDSRQYWQKKSAPFY